MMLPSRLAFGIGWLAVAAIMLSTGTLAPILIDKFVKNM